MDPADAIVLLGGPIGTTPQRWADLGCGTGTFTRALAHRLPAGSTVHAMDRDAQALRALPARAHGVDIRPRLGDLVRDPWPWLPLDGMLWANVLHFVPDRPQLLQRAAAHLKPDGQWIVVEYDTDVPRPPWVPYPLGFEALVALAAGVGFTQVERLGERPSVFGHARLYAVRLRRG